MNDKDFQRLNRYQLLELLAAQTEHAKFWFYCGASLQVGEAFCGTEKQLGFVK